MCIRDSLYTTRQVYLRLGEKTKRVERVALSLGGSASDIYLESIKAEHPFMIINKVDPMRWKTWLYNIRDAALASTNEHVYFLVDQEANAMMFYSTQQHGNELLKDIKRALKYSIDHQ